MALKDHQLIPIHFIKNNYGLILWHGTGTGKTRTALVGMAQFKKRVIIVGPKSSRKAFVDEIEKLKFDKDLFNIYSYKAIATILFEDTNYFKDKCVIIDEAHHLRNDTKNNAIISDTVKHAFRVMLLTATPVINYLNDISVLVNIAKKSDVLPIDKQMFDFLYYDEDNMNLTNEKVFKEKIKNCISYYENVDSKDFPKMETKEMLVKMNDEQINEYGLYIRKIIQDKIFSEGRIDLFKDLELFNLHFNTLKSGKKNSFLSATRQLSNTINGSEDFPKIVEIFKYIKSGPWPIVVYSNYLKNGIYPLIKLLMDSDITYNKITGTTSNDKIMKVVNNYNDKKIKVLLLSSAGSESLDLKNTRQVHIMEPHWNDPKINQVIGRSARFKSHEGLPLKDRNVNVYKWVSIFPEWYKNISADQYLMEISNKKTKIFEAFKKILIECSIENNKQIGGKELFKMAKEIYDDL